MSKSTLNMGKRAQLQIIQGLALSLGIMAVVFAVVLTMLGQLSTVESARVGNLTTGDTTTLAAIGNLTGYTSDVVDWVPIIVTVVIGVGILGLLFAVTRFGKSNQGGF